MYSLELQPQRTHVRIALRTCVCCMQQLQQMQKSPKFQIRMINVLYMYVCTYDDTISVRLFVRYGVQRRRQIVQNMEDIDRFNYYLT